MFFNIKRLLINRFFSLIKTRRKIKFSMSENRTKGSLQKENYPDFIKDIECDFYQAKLHKIIEGIGPKKIFIILNPVLNLFFTQHCVLG